MLNISKIISYDLWDADTGEATVIAEFNQEKQLKASSLDVFEKDSEHEVILSLFCENMEITDEIFDSSIENLDEHHKISAQGLIIDLTSDNIHGDLITIDVGNIYIDVYLTPEYIEELKPQVGRYFKGVGRLDLELPNIINKQNNKIVDMFDEF